MNLAVEKKVQQLLNYIQKLTQPTIGEMQARMLVDISGTLRGAIDNLQCTWAIKRDELHRQDLDMVSQSVSETISTGEAALRKAERFVIHGDPGRQPPRGMAPNSPGRVDKLDNTLKPSGNLTRDMSLEEARNWIRKFDEWFKWNEYGEWCFRLYGD